MLRVLRDFKHTNVTPERIIKFISKANGVKKINYSFKGEYYGRWMDG